MTRRALLFDLDGTLLPLDLETFLHGCFSGMARRVGRWLAPDELVNLIWAAVKDTVENDDSHRTNDEVFREAFMARAGAGKEEVWAEMEAFYEEEFAQLRHLTRPTDLAQEICRTALEQGYELVVATNPIFPEKAIHERLRWAGLEAIPFRLVTTMENSHYCKPRVHYYREILTKIGRCPEECTMIGNDVVEDGAAAEAGIAVGLVTDCLVGSVPVDRPPAWTGTLTDVLEWIKHREI
ncbi:HAD family hydrolase [Kyrpidia sp.]|uniref:HAD family hydrolase n=1 Tax=Kyrpidia sp. TaxID=2073077 RepID=UPI00258EA8BE|nr:HAD family hydrolase [Kyrpidia sp.]